MNLEEIKKAATEQGVTEGELRQMFRDKGYSEDQISEYLPFDYDTFYTNASQQKKTNNQMREMLKQEGMSEDYIDSKIKYDIAEARDNIIQNYGLTDSDVKEILSDKGYSNAEIANMYRYGGYAQKLISKGYTQEDVKNYATRMIQDMNMNYTKARKLLSNFFGLGYQDSEDMIKSLYGEPISIPNRVKQYRDSGMSYNDATIQAKKDYRDYREKGIKDKKAGLFQETFNLVGYPIVEGLGRVYQAGKSALADIGLVDKTIEDEIMSDYYRWRAEDNPVVQAASKAPLIAASLSPQGLAAGLATGFGTSYMESKMEGKTAAEAFKDASIETGVAMGLVSSVKGMPYLWEGIKSLKSPVEAGKSSLELFGRIFSFMTEPFFIKNVLKTYNGDKKLAKEMLEELKLLDNKESLMLGHLQQNPETNTLTQRLTDLQGRSVLGSVKTTERTKAAESEILKAYDEQKEKLFGKSKWEAAVAGVNQFQERVKNVVSKAHDIRVAEHNELYDSARKSGSQVEMNAEDAKKLRTIVDDLDKFIETNQSAQGASFLGNTAKNLLSRYKLGDSLVIDSLKSFYSSQVSKGLGVIESKNITHFENTLKNTFKDKFSKEELKSALAKSKQHLNSLNAGNSEIMKKIAKIEAQLLKKEQLKRPTARSKEIVQELLAKKSQETGKLVSKDELDYMRKELKYMAKYIGELDRFKKTPNLDDLKVSLQRFREFDPSLPFVKLIQGKADEGIKKVIFGKETFKKDQTGAYEKFVSSLEEANEKYRIRKELYDNPKDSPGLYQLHKTSDDYVNTLVKSLDNSDSGLATAEKLSKEIDLAYGKNTAESRDLKAAIAGYIVDYKTQSAINKLSSSNDTALTVKELITDLDSIPNGIFESLGVKEAPKVLNLLKKTLNRVKVLSEKTTPTRLNLPQDSFNPFNMILKFMTSSAFGYVLRSPKTAQKAIRELEKLAYADDPVKMAELARKYKEMSGDSNLWYSALARSQMLYNEDGYDPANLRKTIQAYQQPTPNQ